MMVSFKINVIPRSYFFCKAKETHDILSTILEAYPKSQTDNAGKSDDEIVLEMIIDISGRLMKTINIDHAHFTIMETDDKGRLPSLSTVLLQEIERFNKLLDVLHNSLNDLRKAIKGLVVMSAELEGVYLSFMNNSVRYYNTYVIIFFYYKYTKKIYSYQNYGLKKHILH
jgi:dynein heavy chain